MKFAAQLAGLGFFVILFALAALVAGVSAILNWLEEQEGLLDEYSDLPCAASAISSAKAVGAHDGLSPRTVAAPLTIVLPVFFTSACLAFSLVWLIWFFL